MDIKGIFHSLASLTVGHRSSSGFKDISLPGAYIGPMGYHLDSRQIREVKNLIGLKKPVDLVYYPGSRLDFTHPIVLVDARKYVLVDIARIGSDEVLEAARKQLSGVGGREIKIEETGDKFHISFSLFWPREILFYRNFDFINIPQDLDKGVDVIFDKFSSWGSFFDGFLEKGLHLAIQQKARSFNGLIDLLKAGGLSVQNHDRAPLQHLGVSLVGFRKKGGSHGFFVFQKETKIEIPADLISINMCLEELQEKVRYEPIRHHDVQWPEIINIKYHEDNAGKLRALCDGLPPGIKETVKGEVRGWILKYLSKIGTIKEEIMGRFEFWLPTSVEDELRIVLEAREALEVPRLSPIVGPLRFKLKAISIFNQGIKAKGETLSRDFEKSMEERSGEKRRLQRGGALLFPSSCDSGIERLTQKEMDLLGATCDGIYRKIQEIYKKNIE